MTTPDKEEMPTKHRNAGPRWVQSPHHPRVLYDSASNGGIIECDSPEVAAYIATACNAYEPMREALEKAKEGLKAACSCIDNPLLRAPVIDALNAARAALSTLPVNDRHHSGSDSYQADAGAPALSEKVNDRSEWLPIESAPRDGTHILAFGPQPGCNAREHGWTEVRETHFEHSGWDWYEAVHNRSHKWKPTHWMPLPSPPGAEVTISNEPERDAVRLKSDTSSQPASDKSGEGK